MNITRVITLALSILASGCAIHYPTSFNEAYIGKGDGISSSRKAQGNALIIMTDGEQSRIHASRAAYFLGGGSEYSFEVGKITKAAAERVFSRVFAGEVKVTTSPTSSSMAPTIRPSVKALEWWYRPTSLGYDYQEVVRIDLSVVIERNGQRVFDKTYSSGEVAGEVHKIDPKNPVPLGTMANKVVHQTIRQLMEQAAIDFIAQQ